MPSSASLPLEAEATDLSVPLCRVGLMIILPHLAEGVLQEFVCQAPEMRTFTKAIPAVMETTHTWVRATHVHTS